MNIDKHAPVHNLKVVLQESGLKADTVRAWERRYGLPRPERSAGGHRLYSYYDIEIVKWLLARQDEGMRISQAVDLFGRLENEGQDAKGWNQAAPESEHHWRDLFDRQIAEQEVPGADQHGQEQGAVRHGDSVLAHGGMRARAGQETKPPGASRSTCH